jgi:[acyl-carrier-protein] S-malonyltransferase
MTDSSRVAFVFPGQGSQSAGMGKDVAAAFPAAAQTFNEADDILGYSLSALMFDGDETELAQTIHTQPAMFVSSAALLRVLAAAGYTSAPAAAAGHSLGELTAVHAAGALAFADGVRLVQERARLMQQAGQQASGGMAAVLNLGPDILADLCEQASHSTGKTVVIANDNCPGQIVISGHVEALEAAVELAKAAGARRAVRLNVSTANHSPLMQPAEDAFADVVAATPLVAAALPVYANLTAQPVQSAADIRHELSQQLTRRVRWTETIQNMIAAGIHHFVEVGNKDVLSGLIRRIDSTVTVSRIGDVATLQEFLSR